MREIELIPNYRKALHLAGIALYVRWGFVMW